MASILTIMGKHKITVYRICKILGLGIGSHTRVKKMVHGEATITMERFQKIEEGLKYVNDEKIDYKIERISL